MNKGILGMPRLTDIGPLVNSAYSESKQKRKDLIHQLVVEERNKIAGESSNIDEETALQIGKSVADRLFDPSVSDHVKAKNNKLKQCIDNKWANEWVVGLDDSMDQDYSELEKMQLKIQGCTSLTENHTPSDDRLL